MISSTFINDLGNTPGSCFICKPASGLDESANIVIGSFDSGVSAVEFENAAISLYWGTDPTTHLGTLTLTLTTTSTINYDCVINYYSNATLDLVQSKFTISNGIDFNDSSLINAANYIISGTIIPRTSDYINISQAYSDGYDLGYNDGHSIGFNEGVANANTTTLGFKEVMTTIFDSADKILKIELLPNFSVGGLITIPICLSMIIFLIKFIRGN